MLPGSWRAKLVQVQVEGTSNRNFVAAATLDERATSVDTTTTELCLSQNTEEFAGNTSGPSENDSDCWIIDCRATNHICETFNFFIHTLSLHTPNTFTCLVVP